MPIAIVTRKPRRIQAHHQPCLTKPNLRDQSLEALPIPARGPGLAKVIVDDMNPLAWPPEQHRSLDQPVLQLGALLMMTDLPRR